MCNESAPAPFSAEVLRAGVRAGESWAFAQRSADGVETINHTSVLSADDDGSVFSFWVEGPEGEPLGPPREATFAWSDLVGHATYPLAATQIREVTESVPAGTFEGWRYTVEQPDGAVVEAFFARDLVGPPVRWERFEDGESGARMLLLFRRPE